VSVEVHLAKTGKCWRVVYSDDGRGWRLGGLGVELEGEGFRDSKVLFAYCALL
jgi:hypothetical protein